MEAAGFGTDTQVVITVEHGQLVGTFNLIPKGNLWEHSLTVHLTTNSLV
ncbi:hypothetical protein [Pectobacterium polaris]